jgi:hypothetical protein
MFTNFINTCLRIWTAVFQPAQSCPSPRSRVPARAVVSQPASVVSQPAPSRVPARARATPSPLPQLSGRHHNTGWEVHIGGGGGGGHIGYIVSWSKRRRERKWGLWNVFEFIESLLPISREFRVGIRIDQYSLGHCEHVQYTTDVKYVQQTIENVHEYQV